MKPDARQWLTSDGLDARRAMDQTPGEGCRAIDRTHGERRRARDRPDRIGANQAPMWDLWAGTSEMTRDRREQGVNGSVPYVPSAAES